MGNIMKDDISSRIANITANQLEEGDSQSAHLTVGQVFESIKDIGSEYEQKQIRRWYEEQNHDVSELIDNLEPFIETMNDFFVNIVSNDTLQQIFDVIRSLF